MKKILIFLTLLTAPIFAQIPTATHIQILKAEDARRYDKTLKDLLKHPNEQVRIRAALAAGRIGSDAAIPALETMLGDNLRSPRVLAMAAFAIGEIESIKGAETILDILKSESGYAGRSEPLLSRAVEAAGKIAAANPNETKSKELAAAIVRVLSDEVSMQKGVLTEVVRLGLTAVLRARPAGAEETVQKFLSYIDPKFSDPNIVAGALNTLARLRAKNANRDARDLLATHTNAIVRANAARVLGAAEDKEAVDVLIKAAITDTDSRVRVSSIRALGAIKDAKAGEPLIKRGETLLEAYKKSKKPGFILSEQSEFLEISTALGQIMAKTGNARAIALFREFAMVDQFHTAEPYLARVQVGGMRPGKGPGDDAPTPTSWRQYSTLVQIIGELSVYEPESEETKKLKEEAPEEARKLAKAFLGADPKREAEAIMAAPDALRAFARFKTGDLAEVLLSALKNDDLFIRAAAAGLLAELPASKGNVDALKAAYPRSILSDKKYNDASLAILDALYKLDKRGSVETFLLAAIASDYLVRKKAFELLADKELQQEFPKIAEAMENATKYKTRQVLPYSHVSSTRLGQLFATDADYRRAALRKNRSIKAVLTTEKGAFTIDLLPEDAPLTVDNFVKLARSGYFNGLDVHRVVPNFVMQDGDPRGDGNGGPGWSIRCEINMVPYERGAVGMALSGKDTGGSQWFVTHSPQPHLDGGYTVFGSVNEAGMKVVDNIVRGDKIISVRIVGK